MSVSVFRRRPSIVNTVPGTAARAGLLAVAAALVTLAAPSAEAQVPGLYRGTTSQGQTIEVTLTDNGVGGVDFGGMVVFWNATCRTSGPGRSVAWGVGATVPLNGGTQLDWEFKSNALYERIRFAVSGTAMTGYFGGRTPEFVDVNASTTRVELCESGVLTFNATWDPPIEGAARAAPAAGARKLF